MSFREVLKRAKGVEPDEASELWECAFLTREELEELLAYIKGIAKHSCIYPMFVFCGHTGARRSEMARARMGGFGVVRTAAAHRDLFAAAVPISGGGHPADTKQLRDLPLWAFHGAADTTAP